MKVRILRAMCALVCAALLAPGLTGCTGQAEGLYAGAQAPGEYEELSSGERAAIPLVNAEHPLPEGFALEQVEGRAEGGYEVRSGFSPLVNLYEQRHSFRLASSDIWLCRHVYEAMERMFAAAEAEDMNGFIITSGYRSRQRQQEIYDESEAGVAALPGCSEHETGLSFDVTAYSGGDFGSTPQYAWLIAHCWDYGFILRYPGGASDITGIVGESWHFRYVGEKAAREILARDITLEEYLADVEPAGIPAEPLGAGTSAAGAPAAAATIRPPAQPTARPTDAPSPAPTAQPTDAPEPLMTVTPVERETFEPTALEGESMEFIDPTYVQREGVDVIYLAGGCFWGMEKLMQSLDGVLAATNGYANGSVPAPDYSRVRAGDTGHRETVRVEYDPGVISLDDILYAYFEVVDPELVDRQGHDVGSQYQAGIYCVSADSLATVERAAEAKRAQYPHFAVEIGPLVCFYDAEEYHQDYLDKNPGGYCHIPLATIERVARELNG